MKKPLFIAMFLGSTLSPTLLDYDLLIEKKIPRQEEHIQINPVADSVKKHATTYNIDPKLILLMIYAESTGRTTAKSHKGAYGLMQLLPKTAKEMGVDHLTIDGNIEGGVKYFAKQLTKFKSIKLALAAYNSGPGNVYKYKGIPPFTETINYVNRICNNYSCG
jgi:soluble lytic murein transglycosylase-like protein